MPEVDAMKYIVFLIATFSIQLVLGSQAFNGYLTKKGDEVFFTPKSSELLYKVIATTFDVQESLARLDNGDFVSGNGTLDTTNKKISVQSIDYVGLQKLLGPWVGTDGTIVFKDYTTMRFIPRFRDLTLDTRLARYQREFRYSVSPKDSNEWALFMSDSMNTTFATVEFTKNKIILKIFESESGNIVRTLKLERP
jgi:hypothetical protein